MAKFSASNACAAAQTLFRRKHPLIPLYYAEKLLHIRAAILRKRYQIVDIYYKGVGIICGFPSEEMAEVFKEDESRRGYESPAQSEDCIGS